MKRIFLGLLMGSALAIFAFGADQSFTGTVSDSHCGAKHAMKGMSAEACTRACTKGGADYALVVGEKVYTLKGDKEAVDKAGNAPTSKSLSVRKILPVPAALLSACADSTSWTVPLAPLLTAIGLASARRFAMRPFPFLGGHRRQML